MRAADGKIRLTDVADPEQLFRIIQSERHAVPFERASALLNLERCFAALEPRFSALEPQLCCIEPRLRRLARASGSLHARRA